MFLDKSPFGSENKITWRLLKLVSGGWRLSLKHIDRGLAVLMEWWVLLFRTTPFLVSHKAWIVVAVKGYLRINRL